MYNLIQKYDKLSHFIAGMLMFFLSIQLAISIMVIKEIYDCHKKNPTGFDLCDIMAGVGGWMLVTEIIKMI